MSEKFNKTARKRSNDPQQEKLRQAKDAWNQDVKTLIAGLIAFKRGINGRGDPRASLPPSSIKDPLPPQIGQYLNSIANQYGKVIDDAKSIIDAQTYYSEHRRKPQENQNPAITASVETSLIVQASWWGSRTWAYFSLLRNLDRKNRRLRLNMIKSALEVKRELKRFDHVLAERDPNSAARSLTILATVCSEFSAVFLRMFNKLSELSQEAEKAKAKNETDKKSITETTTKSEQKEVKAPAVDIPTSDETTSTSEEQTVSADLWDHFKRIYSQLVKMEVVLRYIFTLENADKSNFVTMRQSFDKFVRDVNVLYDLSRRSDHDKSVVELTQLTKDIANQYQYLLSAATAILGPASSFDQLAGKIPAPTVSAYIEILQQHETIKKLANNTVSNWLNKMWLSVNPDNIDRMKLEMVDSAGTLRSAIDKMMDKLEDRDQDINSISKNLQEVSKLFVDLLDQGIRLAKNYMIAGRRQEKGKNYHLSDIRTSDIKILNELRHEIATYAG